MAVQAPAEEQETVARCIEREACMRLLVPQVGSAIPAKDVRGKDSLGASTLLLEVQGQLASKADRHQIEALNDQMAASTAAIEKLQA